MKKTLLITILIIAIGLYLQNKDEKSPSLDNPTDQQPVTSESAPPEKNITPQKVTKKAQPKRLKLVPKQSTSPNAKYPGLGEDFVPFDEDGNRYVTQLIQDGRHLTYHGDVLVGDVKDLKKIQKTGFIKVSKPRTWTEGKVPYVIDDSVPQYEKIMEAIEYVNQITNIQFIPREDQTNYVLITQGDSDCYSYVGMMGGMQEIFLTQKCGVKEIIHEFTHTMGFFHEQNREDRDQYVKVLWDNIDDVHHTQFKKIPNDFLGITNRPFDIHSLMMYSSYTFSIAPNEPALITVDEQIIPHSKNYYSEEDINRINLAYPEN